MAMLSEYCFNNQFIYKSINFKTLEEAVEFRDKLAEEYKLLKGEGIPKIMKEKKVTC